MKRKLLLMCAVLCSIQMMCINLVFEKTDGTEQSHNVSLIGKWLFVDRDLLLIDKEGNILASEPVLNIRKIVFDGKDATGNLSPISKTDNAIMVYPNPTKDILHVEGAEDHIIRIYNTQGILLKKATGKQINVSNLHTGTYLLQIGTQVVRFIKQ